MNLDEAVALARICASSIDDDVSEIVIERHRFERFVIEEEVSERRTNEREAKQIVAAADKKSVTQKLKEYPSIIFAVVSILVLILIAVFAWR
jgi:hypothetical protein